MSSGNLYPPQAFTREMLSQAFVWLQTQPVSVKDLARNPESLIAVYLKHQRAQLHNQRKMDDQNSGQSSNPQADAPVSAQNFMTDLKSLAEGLKQFEDPVQAAPQSKLPPVPNQMPLFQQAAQHHAPTPPQQHQQQGQQGFAAQLRQEVQANRTTQANHSHANINTQAQHPTAQPTQATHSAQPAPLASQLNSNSQYMIREVKEKFNLSSDHEALNMLVAIAYKNLKSLLD